MLSLSAYGWEPGAWATCLAAMLTTVAGVVVRAPLLFISLAAITLQESYRQRQPAPRPVKSTIVGL